MRNILHTIVARWRTSIDICRVSRRKGLVEVRRSRLLKRECADPRGRSNDPELG